MLRPRAGSGRWLALLLLPASCLAPGAASARPNEILGYSSERERHAGRLILQCAAPARPRLQPAGDLEVRIDLPDTLPGRMPAATTLDLEGVQVLKSALAGSATRLILRLERPMSVRLVPAPDPRQIAVEIGAASPERGSSRRKRDSEPEAARRPAGTPQFNTGRPARAPSVEREPPKAVPAAPRVAMAPPLPSVIGRAPAPAVELRLRVPRASRPAAAGPAPAPVALEAAAAKGAVAAERMAPRLVGITLQAVGKGVQVRLLTTGPARVRHHFLRGQSPRCFIDVAGAVLGGPLLPVPPAGGAVTGVRVGQFSLEPPVCRVVLDLRAGTRPERLAARGKPLAMLSFPGSRAIASVPVTGGPSPRRAARAVVAIDAGHGGRDPGALAPGGAREKDIALDVSLRLARYLEELGHEVRLSRRGDATLPPPARTAWMKANRSDVLVSIHCDAVAGRSSVRGATTYYHQGHAPSRKLARIVQQRLVKTTGAVDLGARSDATRTASGFYVLRRAGRPAVLVEIGYITHRPTERLLRQPEYRQRVAAGIGDAVAAYLAQ